MKIKPIVQRDTERRAEQLAQTRDFGGSFRPLLQQVFDHPGVVLVARERVVAEAREDVAAPRRLQGTVRRHADDVVVVGRHGVPAYFWGSSGGGAIGFAGFGLLPLVTEDM